MAATKSVSGDTHTFGEWRNRTRYGWGWEIWGPDGNGPMPVSSSLAADEYCRVRSEGGDHEAAAQAVYAVDGYFKGQH